MLRLKKGDKEAFDGIFKMYINQAVKTAFLITGDSFICEDIVQEAFIICYENINKLKNPDAFKSYFYKILVNLAIKRKLKYSKDVLTDDFSFKNELSFCDKYKDEYDELYEEVRKLDKKHRTVIVLFYFNDMSIKDIASVTGTAEATVKSRLFFARKKLKKALSRKYCGGEIYG